MQICIIGAGTVGLSQALHIKQTFKDQVNVTIIADRFVSETTSYGSGGKWQPSNIAGTPDEKVNGWGHIAFEHFKQLLYSPDAEKAGVQLQTVYILKEQHEDSSLPTWRNIVFNFKQLTLQDIEKMGLPAKFTHGYTFTTFTVEQRLYMPWIMDNLKTKWGVTFHEQKVENLQNFVKTSKFDIVINCAGLGAAKLIGKEDDVVPIRGQVVRVKAPFFKSAFSFGTSYIIPNVNYVVLGGTSQIGNWDTTPSEADTKKILKDICEVFPIFQDVPIENVWVGLRPSRTPLRLDSQVYEGKLIVHNYGHGGSGITLAMGTAEDVVNNHIKPYFNIQRAKL